ncbi:hypothetical protein PMAYCL1PPCAC_27108, partial [Pristionchus mayeri]
MSTFKFVSTKIKPTAGRILTFPISSTTTKNKKKQKGKGRNNAEEKEMSTAVPASASPLLRPGCRPQRLFQKNPARSGRPRTARSLKEIKNEGILLRSELNVRLRLNRQLIRELDVKKQQLLSEATTDGSADDDMQQHPKVTTPAQCKEYLAATANAVKRQRQPSLLVLIEEDGEDLNVASCGIAPSCSFDYDDTTVMAADPSLDAAHHDCS